ncbi:MAG: class I SAM-dependent methyltransferase [bacterium]
MGLRSYEDVDWDTWWKWEIFRRQVDPVDFRRWKGDSSRALRGLPCGVDRAGVAPRLLDSTCGMGYHALVQHGLGFRTEACDASARVVECARGLAEGEGVDMELFEARWERLGELRPQRYDLVFNDEIHQVWQAAELEAALHGIHGALRPGGALVFFFADAQKPNDGAAQARWDWDRSPREHVAWEEEADGLRVALSVRREREGPHVIAEHHDYVIREGEAPVRRESLTLKRCYRWDWSQIVPVLRRVGFTEVESHRFVNVYGRFYAMNLAFR